MNDIVVRARDRLVSLGRPDRFVGLTMPCGSWMLLHYIGQHAARNTKPYRLYGAEVRYSDSPLRWGLIERDGLSVTLTPIGISLAEVATAWAWSSPEARASAAYRHHDSRRTAA